MPTPSPRDVVIVKKRSAQPKQVRISRKVRKICEAMAYDGVSREEARKAVGLTYDAARKAFKKQEVLAYLKECMGDLRTSEAPRALARVVDLAHNGRSDNVRLQASQFLLGIEGVRPVEKHEHQHEHRIVPGYVLDPHAHDDRQPEHIESARFIEGEGHEVPATADNSEPVQRPAPGDDAQHQDEGAPGLDSARHEKAPGGKNGRPR